MAKARNDPDDTMGQLTLLDLAIILLYFVGITAIGSYFYRRGTTMQEYLIGSGKMTWFPVAISILAADTSALSYLGIPAWSFLHDTKLSLGIFAYFFAVPVVIWIFVPIYSRGGLYTAYQFLESRFDLRVRLLTSFLFLLVRSSHVALIIYAPALVMSELMGIPLSFSILAMGLLTAFYTTMGGIKAVIWTDCVQVGTVLVGLSTVALSALHNIPGGVDEVVRTGWANGKFRFFDFSMSLDKVDNSWGMIIGGILLGVQAMGTDQAVLQKYFTTKSKKETIRSLIFYGALVIPLTIFLSILGVILYVFYSTHPELKSTLNNTEAVVPHFAATMLSNGLAGLVVASIFAGSMSTVSASLNSLATSSVVDVYKRLTGINRSDEHYALASRWATLSWGALATVGALYAFRLGPLMTSFLKIQSFLGGVVLGIFLLGVIDGRTTGTGVILGAAIGLAAVIYTSLFSSVSIYWYVVIGCLTTGMTGWLWSVAFLVVRQIRHPFG